MNLDTPKEQYVKAVNIWKKALFCLCRDQCCMDEKSILIDFDTRITGNAHEQTDASTESGLVLVASSSLRVYRSLQGFVMM